MVDGPEYEQRYQNEIDEFLFIRNFTVRDADVKAAMIARRQGEMVLLKLIHDRMLKVVGEIDNEFLGVGDLEFRFIGPMEENNDNTN
jgi:hypothetical protein